jgi:hypothetical protein
MEAVKINEASTWTWEAVSQVMTLSVPAGTKGLTRALG